MRRRTIYLACCMLLSAFSCPVFAKDVLTVRYDGSKVKVSDVKPTDSVLVRREGSMVYVENLAKVRPLTIRLSGTSDDGQLMLKTSTKDKIELDNVTLQSRQGAPIWIKNKKKVEVVARNKTVNTLTVAACPDTAAQKAAVIYAKDKLLLSGKGHLTCLAKGDGCKGIQSKKDITIADVTLDVKTTGNNLGKKENEMWGPHPRLAEGEEPHHGWGPGFGGPFGDPFGGPFGGPFGAPSDSIPENRKLLPFGEARGWSFNMAGPPEGEGPEDANDGGGFKQKYISTCKGIKSAGKVIIQSGNVTVYTSSAGAEGIEGKEGVIVNGGMVDVNAKDDAINANAAIYFNGGKTKAISRDNDAVDANPEGGFFPPFGPFGEGGPGAFGPFGEGGPDVFGPFGEEGPAAFNPQGSPHRGGDGREGKEGLSPLIFIAGGEVLAYSWKGAPEEGLDCDFNPIEVTGGTAFSIGAGMGDMPSVPTVETAKQLTALLIGMNVVKGQPITLKDARGKVLFTTQAPFSFNNSSSLLTCPDLKVGESYTMECGEWHKEFRMEEKFTVVR